MVCRYRLREKGNSRFVEGILISQQWTVSKEELPLLERWPLLVEIQKAEREDMFSVEDLHEEIESVERLPPDPSTMSNEELKSWAHSYGIQESEYSGLTRERLIELIEVAKEMGN